MKPRTTKAKPVAVLIADVHYNINTLAVADAAMRQAIAKANELGVPFIVAGDLHDTKAQMRGECIKAMIETFKLCQTSVFVLVGNHDRINEKSEAHALEFLRPYARVVEYPTELNGLKLIPYYSSADELRALLEKTPNGSTLIMHQGVQTAFMGHYIQDKTSLPPEAFADLRVISGHYHRRQDIKCGRPRKGAVGLFSYIGNPYSLTFGEANDGPKGFQVLMDNGILEFHPTNLRKHVIHDCTLDQSGGYGYFTRPNTFPGDLVWFKLRGPKSELDKVNKNKFGLAMLGTRDYKLDLIPTDSAVLEPVTKPLQDTEILDKLIDNMPDPTERKSYLKQLWRDLLQ